MSATPVAVGLHRRDRSLLADRHAVLDQARAHDGGKLGIVAPEHPPPLDQRDLGAEAAEGLRHLDPDRAAAQHQQMAGLGRRIEQGLVGQVGNPVEAPNAGDDRCGAGGDDEAPRGDAGIADLNETRRGEAGLAEHHVDAKAAEALDRIVRLDGRDRAPHVVVGGGETVAARGGGQQCLGGHATGVQALPAHPGLLDQDHRCAHLDGAGGNRKPARSGPDDAEIGPYPVSDGL